MDKTIKPLKYLGTVEGYYPIFFKNLLFSIITLGIYSSWATTNNRRYFIGNTTFFDTNYEYHGTGAELFIGRLKALGIIVALAILFSIYAALFEGISKFLVFLGTLAFVLAIFTLLPIAIVGALKYRLSRISWNQIRHNFSENYNTFIPIFLKGLFISIITLGLYSPFFIVSIWRFAFDNSHMGDQAFHFTGSGSAYFIIALKGFFLIPLTLGIYSFWYLSNVWNYITSNTTLDEKSFHSEISAADVFSLIFPNILILIFTIGLGWPIVITRIFSFYAGKIELDADFDPESVHPGALDMETATGEGLGVLLDLDL